MKNKITKIYPVKSPVKSFAESKRKSEILFNRGAKQFDRVKKRDGRIVNFEQDKITKAVYKAITSSGQGDGKKSKRVSNRVVQILNRRFKKYEIPTVEQIQDIVEEVLILENLVETAKAFILYREQRRRIREAITVSEEAVDRVDQYLEKLDWEIQENANMAFSLQGLNHYGVTYIIKKYWLNKIYPKTIREVNESGDLHLHDLDSLACYTFFGREVVIVKLNGQIKLISLKDLYEELSQPEVLLNRKDEAFAKYPKNLYILDKNDWTKVPRMVRKKRERVMRFIKSEQGRSVIVTDNHPFIIKKEKKEFVVEAKEVKEKENLVFSVFIPDLLKSENLFSKRYLYLAEELVNKKYQDFFLEGFAWQDFIKNWQGSLKIEGTLSTSNSANSLNNKLELTENLGYLVGFFIAEGNYDSWKLCITTDDDKTIKKIQRICANLGIRSYLNKNKERTKQINISSSTLKLVFEKVFQIKPLSINKNLPPDILNYNLDFVKGVIAGIIDGDGSVDPDNKAHGASQILIRVSSRTMLEQIATLLQFFGIIARSGANIEDVGKSKIFRGREIIQNYPIYRLNFSKKKGIDFPSSKYKQAKIAERHWRAEEYGWNKVLNNKFTTIPDDTIYDITTDSSTFLANGLLVHNCMGWDLYDLLLKGFGGVSGKVETKPAKHFRAILGQAVNFLYTLQGECAGAIAFSNFDTLLAPFIRYDNLNYQQVKQSLQEFLFNMAVPTRVGFQSPFSNITLDLKPSSVFAKQPIIIGGKPQKETYGEFEEEMKIFNRAFYEIMLEGDKSGRPFHFPIPTINITKDFPWDEPAFDGVFEASAKYGTNYFSNYINSEMKPEDVRSMCKTPDTEIIYKNANGEIAKTEIRRIVDDFLKRRNPIEVLINGEFKPVKDVIKIRLENEGILKVVLDNGIADRMTLDHPSLIIEKGTLKMIESKNLKVGDEFPIAKYPYRGELGDFDLGKLVGLYIGDGWISHNGATLNIVFNEKEKELVQFVEKIAEERFIASTTTFCNEKHHYCRVSMASRGMVEIMREYIRGENSLSKRLNSKIFARSIEFRKGVLTGMIESDGSVNKKKNEVVIHLGNKNLILDILTLARGLGINTTFFETKNRTDEKKKIGYTLRFSAGNPDWFIKYFGLRKGKNQKYNDYGNFYGLKIVKIEKERYTGYVYDFEIESKEHAFQLANGIITHNCCRLRLDMTELHNRGGGGLFGSGTLTGSIGVVTVNLPRIGYLSKTKKEFFEQLGKMMDLARESLEIKRKTIEDFISKGLYPYSKFYLSGIKKARNTYFANHFSTIGLIGTNEAILNFLGENIGSRRGKKFALEVLDFMREMLVKYQKETGNIYNLEQTPAESTSYRLALKDREKYPDIITAGTKENPYYTNSTQLPVNYTDDAFEALKLQDEIQCKYTGGCIEEGNNVLTDKGLMPIEYIVKNFGKLKPIRALSYNQKKEISEWDEILKAVEIDVKKCDKIRIKGERNLDITTSDWHPFFVLEKFKPNPACPICQEKVKNLKAFASHIKWNPECRAEYKTFPKYQIKEKRADELKVGDYILQNSYNLYPDKETELNNDLMYLIGFFIGDGLISRFIDNRGGNKLEKYKVRFFSEHQEALEKVTKIINKYFKCQVKVIQNSKQSKSLREVSSSKKELSEFFFRYGFRSGEKVYNIGVPQEVKKNINKDNVFSLLSGLIDSDGHIGKRDGDAEYYTVSSKLAEDILEICVTTGLMVSKSIKKTKRKNEIDIWRIRIPQYEMTKIKYKLTNTFALSVIKKVFSNRKKRHLPVVRVKEVSKNNVSDRQFYDLMTKKNHNYLAGKNCLVFIHNSVLHLFLGEKMPDAQAVKNLVKKVFEKFHLPYVTITPTFSICPVHGYLSGEHFTCPKCLVKQPCEVYSRVVGYYRPVTQYNVGKQQEFKDRKEFKIKSS